MLNKKTILIVGLDSDLGTSLKKYFNENKYRVLSTSRRKKLISKDLQYLDLADQASIEKLNLSGVDAAIICASITDQKQCEEDPKYAYEINVKNTILLIDKLFRKNIHIIFPSTSLVYDGSKPFQGSSDQINPSSKYALYKYEVEKEILKSYASHSTILRLSKLITKNYSLFLDWHTSLCNHEEIFPFADLFFSPISIEFASEVLERIIKDKILGTLNLSSGNQISYHYALVHLAKNLGFSVSKIFKGSAKKKISNIHLPHYSTLDTSQLANLGIRIPPSENAVNFFINKLC